MLTFKFKFDGIKFITIKIKVKKFKNMKILQKFYQFVSNFCMLHLNRCFDYQRFNFSFSPKYCRIPIGCVRNNAYKWIQAWQKNVSLDIDNLEQINILYIVCHKQIQTHKNDAITRQKCLKMIQLLKKNILPE